jgi:hypothetical protein
MQITLGKARFCELLLWKKGSKGRSALPKEIGLADIQSMSTSNVLNMKSIFAHDTSYWR